MTVGNKSSVDEVRCLPLRSVFTTLSIYLSYILLGPYHSTLALLWADSFPSPQTCLRLLHPSRLCSQLADMLQGGILLVGQPRLAHPRQQMTRRFV